MVCYGMQIMLHAFLIQSRLPPVVGTSCRIKMRESVGGSGSPCLHVCVAVSKVTQIGASKPGLYQKSHDQQMNCKKLHPLPLPIYISWNPAHTNTSQNKSEEKDRLWEEVNDTKAEEIKVKGFERF